MLATVLFLICLSKLFRKRLPTHLASVVGSHFFILSQSEPSTTYYYAYYMGLTAAITSIFFVQVVAIAVEIFYALLVPEIMRKIKEFT